MPVTGIGSAAEVDPVASLVTALNAATAALTASTASSLQKSSNLSDLASASTARVNLGVQPAFRPEAYGAVGDGSTDDSAAVVAALAAAYAAGGGTVLFDAKTYRINSALTLPDDGTGVSGLAITGASVGRPLRITGVGPHGDAIQAGTSPKGTILDLRYNGSGPAKIDTRYNGYLELDHLTLTNLGTADTKPFFFDTNTQCWLHDLTVLGHTTKTGTACDQDAFVFGGVDTKTVGPGTNEAFAGYGTVVERVFFNRIRRCVYGRASFNANIIRNNMIGKDCGATSSEAAIDIIGASTTNVAYPCQGNLIQGNIFEIGHYPVAVHIKNAAETWATGNGFYDYTVTLTVCYKIEGDSALTGYTFIQDAHYDQSIIDNNIIYDATGVTGGSSGTPVVFARSQVKGLTLAGDLTVIQPDQAQASSSSTIFALRRSGREGSSPNQDLMIMQNSGQLKLGGASCSVSCGTTGTQIAIDGSVVKQSTGNLDLYAGTTSTDTIRVRRGTFRNAVYTTAARPSASTTGAGTVYFDSTLNKPVWSDGANWRTADGTIV